MCDSLRVYHSFNNNSNSGDTVLPCMCFAGWVGICYVAVGPFFTWNTVCITGAIGCKKKWDMRSCFSRQLILYFGKMWILTGVRGHLFCIFIMEAYLGPRLLRPLCRLSVAGSGHTAHYYRSSHSHTCTPRLSFVCTLLLSSAFLKEPKRNMKRVCPGRGLQRSNTPRLKKTLGSFVSVIYFNLFRLFIVILCHFVVWLFCLFVVCFASPCGCFVPL